MREHLLQIITTYSSDEMDMELALRLAHMSDEELLQNIVSIIEYYKSKADEVS